MSHLFPSGGQSIGVSASTSVLPVNIQYLFPLGWTGWISMQSEALSRVFSNTSSKVSILRPSAFYIVQLSHSYMTTGKAITLTRWTFVTKQSNVSAFYLFIFLNFIFKLYIIVLVLPNIKMNPPQVYMCSPP